ncbi:NAD(P)H-dependent oxidoreductase [Streptomyces sp. NBC_01261]|uniref:flavodoxin family protein n=1 Tax=unclassified Streptomyces TaxID=2593676 RepID=UPI002E28327A|nr:MULTISPECIES: NAD(P)H-dependent oxidoreductase [unclassified Streptomyces]
MTRRFLFVLGSARLDGNTELLARRAAEQLPPDVEQEWIRLADHPLPDFLDIRHDGIVGAVQPTENDTIRQLLDATLAATDIVIASPVYWYSLSGLTKRYLDYWSDWLRVPGADFKATMAGRTLWGVSALADDEPVVADPVIGTLNNSAAYLKMRFGGVLLGNGSAPGDVLKDTEALTRAKTFFTQEAPLARFPFEDSAS